jgi:hypothetical protein
MAYIPRLFAVGRLIENPHNPRLEKLCNQFIFLTSLLALEAY